MFKAPFPYETIQRFWNKVNKTDTCWLWTASRRNKGYGAFGYTRDGVTVQDRAHRFSYRIHKGEIPDGMFVLHTCDTPACVNPDHLFLGSNDDNIRDMLKKGRHLPGGTHCGDSGNWKRGTVHHNAKLSEQDIVEIRNMYRPNEVSYSQIAKIFHINLSSAYKIVNRLQWKHVA